jgi:hypothetical protein
MYLKECESDYSKGTCTPMFIAALFTIANYGNSQRCPSTDEWIKDMYLYTMEFYSAIKNEILSFSGKWKEPEDIILNEVSQAQKAKSHIFSFIQMQIHQYYEKQVTLRGYHIWEREGKARKLRRWIWLMHSLYKSDYRIFKLVEITIRRGLSRKMKNREEPI